MKKAILYVRVSTDEQATGYSLQHQEDRLRLYCQHKEIDIVSIYTEDHSAKSFARPAFNKLLEYLKANRGKTDLLLFLKWDRFSRNAGDAYSMITRLNKLGVEPQAIEQPLDLCIPENKLMLAFYLAAPEVENDRRSLNVIAGMRRAMKSGRHVHYAPIGYKNARNDLNEPVIVPGKDAELIQWIFREVARGESNVMDIFREVKRKGLKIQKSNIWNLLRNPVYCGRIFIPSYKDEREATVKATHEPIISEELFEEVQDVLNGRKKNYPVKHCLQEQLPLRGFLECPRCGKTLTGSASRGNGGRYYYYHCLKGCGERVKANTINDKFVSELHGIKANENVIDLFEEIMMDYAKQAGSDKSTALKQLKDETAKNQTRINQAQQLLLDGSLEPDDYKEIKTRYEMQIRQLERKQQELTTMDENLKGYITHGVKLLKNLPEYYQQATLTAKRQIIGSIFPEKLVFEENTYRTTRRNEVVDLICRTAKGLEDNKKRKAPHCEGLSNVVAKGGIEPPTFGL
jgi:site-specific DNA recombinase